MDISDCNLYYPKLSANPSFGEAMRYHAEFQEGQHYDGASVVGDVRNYSRDLRDYVNDGILRCIVDWGHSAPSHQVVLSKFIKGACMSNHGDDGVHQRMNPGVVLTIHGIGRRPAMSLIASSTDDIEFDSGAETCSFPDIMVSWKHPNTISEENCTLYPEYLATLQILGRNNAEILRRTLHIAPPIIGPLQFRLEDIVWAPGLFPNDEEKSINIIQRIHKDTFDRKFDKSIVSSRRRRGFGLELETVQLPLNSSDFDADCYTQQMQFEATVERVKRWHLSEMTEENSEYTVKIESINKMWDQIQSWSVSHDLYVENAAPPSRIDLFRRIRAHATDPKNKLELKGFENSEMLRALDDLVLGGKVCMPSELLLATPYKEVQTSQASPEYKSPPPPNELYHVFPPPSDGRDEADALIHLFLDGTIKNPIASTKPIIVPLVSDIGQSASSIHVHVNVANPNAWPRQTIDEIHGIEHTKSLLCVIFGWISFDRVIQSSFCMPNVWRDRSFAPMLPSGPEFVWREPVWDQGSSVSTLHDNVIQDINAYNLRAWFCHVHSCYNSMLSQDDNKESSSGELFQSVFHHETMLNTISRWNSLNLLPINSYGTIEFRRMHASLDADFVSAWTWFCVGFVETFSSVAMYDRFLNPYLDRASHWKMGLELLTEAQNNATLEDLLEIITGDGDGALPPNIFDVLMRNSNATLPK